MKCEENNKVLIPWCKSVVTNNDLRYQGTGCESQRCKFFRLTSPLLNKFHLFLKFVNYLFTDCRFLLESASVLIWRIKILGHILYVVDIFHHHSFSLLLLPLFNQTEKCLWFHFISWFVYPLSFVNRRESEKIYFLLIQNKKYFVSKTF